MSSAAPDPLDLLDRHEASQVLGIPLGGPIVTDGGESVALRYAAIGPGRRRWVVTVQALHAPDARDVLPRVLRVAASITDARPLPGLGDAALRSRNRVYLADGETLYAVAVATPHPEGDGHRAERIARCVLARRHSRHATAPQQSSARSSG